MADDAYDWNWRRNLPPIATIFPTLGQQPSIAPMADSGVPGSTPVYTRPYTAAPPAPSVGPGYTPNLVGNPVGVKFDSGIPLGDFGNPRPTAASGQPADADKTWKEKLAKALENKDFMGGLALLAKGTGRAGGPTPPHPFRVSGASMGHGLPDLKGAGGNLMAQALAKMAGDEWDLTVPRKRKPGQRDRYDILRGQ